MFQVQYANASHLSVWAAYDEHISRQELMLKIRDQQCYVLKINRTMIGVMRYNLFWDCIPFLTMLYLDETARKKGYGSKAMLHWETEMRTLGYSFVMTSTRADEAAQFFYRKRGYVDAGCLLLDLPPFAQPTELFFVKKL